MTTVGAGSRLVLYLSGLRSLLHRVTSARVSTAALTESGKQWVWSKDSVCCRAQDQSLTPRPRSPMDCHLEALSSKTYTTPTTAPPTDLDLLLPQTEEQSEDRSSEFFDSASVECALQPCPPLLLRDVPLMFPLAPPAGLTVVTVAQRSRSDMTKWSAAVEQEREELLQRFIDGATKICSELHREGFWADFIDPASGLAFFGPYTNLTLFETDERFSLLGFSVEDLGCCRVLRHPLWGTNVFAGAIFTDAPAPGREPPTPAAPARSSRVMEALQGREPPTCSERSGV